VEELFVSNPLDVKENDEHALDITVYVSSLSVLVGLDFHVRFKISSPNDCLIISNVSSALLPRFAQNLKLFLYRTHREIATTNKMT
jgi:hypothetical protein